MIQYLPFKHCRIFSPQTEILKFCIPSFLFRIQTHFFNVDSFAYENSKSFHLRFKLYKIKNKLAKKDTYSQYLFIQVSLHINIFKYNK